MKKKLHYILIPIILISLCFVLYFQKNLNTHQKCPEAYAENDIGTKEYRNALIDWTTEFFKVNPKATISDWSIAKFKLWEDHQCEIAIQRSKMSGDVKDLKQWEKIDYEVQSSLDKTINNN